MNFKDLGISESLLEGLSAMGFETPTPIQEEAIPYILDGRDLLACAQTGTGKTAAFLLPTIDIISHTEVSNSIDTLILVPTRELAVQIDMALEGFAYYTGITSISIYGGRDGRYFEQEKKALTTGADIVIATPGRLIAHLNLGYVKTNNLKAFILDEADRMLDMGFISDIEKITKFLPKERQTLMFSATMPAKIRKFSKTILKDPHEIRLAVSKPAENVLQGIYKVHDGQKMPLLKHLLGKRVEKKDDKVIIFSSTKSMVKETARELKRVGVSVGEVHSDLDQSEREVMLRQFKNGSLNVIVATDVLSRGIDVKGINLVINVDVPSDGEDYIHRIGRTARADADGVAITLVNRRDVRKFKDIETMMDMQIRPLPIPDFIIDIPEPPRNDRRGGGRGGNSRGGKRGGGNNRGRNSNNKGRGGNKRR